LRPFHEAALVGPAELIQRPAVNFRCHPELETAKGILAEVLGPALCRGADDTKKAVGEGLELGERAVFMNILPRGQCEIICKLSF
jgi:hypothetical protein